MYEDLLEKLVDLHESGILRELEKWAYKKNSTNKMDEDYKNIPIQKDS